MLLRSFQIEKVVVGSPAEEAGLKEKDFLVSVQGQVSMQGSAQGMYLFFSILSFFLQEIFDCKHKEVRGSNYCTRRSTALLNLVLLAIHSSLH